MRAIVVAVGLVALASAPVRALDFSEMTNPEGEHILLIHDRHPCPHNDPSCGFYKGDADHLEQILRSKTYSQIWLASGGGQLDEGIRMGVVFRQHGLRVHVPDDAYCASSCTVAFMGGVVRSVGPKGQFLVHSASFALEGVDDQTRASLQRDPELTLERLADELYGSEKNEAARLIGYFQMMLNGKPDLAALKFAVNRGPASLPYVTDGRLKADAQKIQSEGSVVMQDIFMSLERQSVAQAIDNARPAVAELGPRAGPALKLIETMYTSRITEVADLSQQTLYELGYVNVRPK